MTKVKIKITNVNLNNPDWDEISDWIKDWTKDHMGKVVEGKLCGKNVKLSEPPITLFEGEYELIPNPGIVEVIQVQGNDGVWRDFTMPMPAEDVEDHIEKMLNDASFKEGGLTRDRIRLKSRVTYLKAQIIQNVVQFYCKSNNAKDFEYISADDARQYALTGIPIIIEICDCGDIELHGEVVLSQPTDVKSSCHVE